MEWNAAFYEDGILVKSITDEFTKMVQYNSYQYFSFYHKNKAMVIHKKDEYGNPTHNERWDFIMTPYINELPNSIVLDIGANMGFWSLQSLHFGAKKAIMFEAEKGYFDITKVLLDFFGFTGKIDFVQGDFNDLDKLTFPCDIALFMRVLHFLPENKIKSILKTTLNHTKKFVVINPIETYLVPMLNVMNRSVIINDSKGKYLSTAIIGGQLYD